MNGIFHIRDDGQLVSMDETPYDSEGLLQELLARYPDLLPGAQVDSGEPRRWLLITREMGVPGDEGAGDRWSLDHLFLDQDGVPTLVEVKRSTDTRIRREVVGQLLDYAANAVVYWPVEGLKAAFEMRCAREEKDSEAELTRLIGPTADPEAFWQHVKTNLQAGRVRLLFIADEIPDELRRVVEFLNGQMDPAEVLALEVKQYAGQGGRTLIPRLIGQTVQAQQKKTTSRDARQWDEPSFFGVLETRSDPRETQVARALLEWGRKRMSRIWWGRGSQTGSFVPILTVGGNEFRPVRVWHGYSTAQVELNFPHAHPPPFDNDAGRLELIERLNRVPGISLGRDVVSKYPNVRLTDIAEAGVLEAFLEVLDWAVGRVKAATGSA